MADLTSKYQSLTDVYRDLTLFFKITSNLQFSLADFTAIAEARWDYLRTNWDFIKNGYVDRINLLQDGPNKVNAKTQYIEFTNLVTNSRTTSQNPLSERNNLRKYRDLLDVIYTNDLKLTQIEQNIINNDIKRVSSLQKDDFAQMRERVRITHDKTADSMGLEDATYNYLFGRVSVPQVMAFNVNNFPILTSLISLMNQITSLMPTKLIQDERPDPFLVIRNALNNPSIPVVSSQIGFVVPFPAGGTLERLASQYLGTPDRALELATANGLKFPYVDEIGKKTYFVVNGIGNIVIVDISEYDNFFVNQEVFIGSNGKKLIQRVILNIEQDKNNNQLLIYLNGVASMSDYVTTQDAYVFSYAPYTINSDKLIMIPSPGKSGFPINAQTPWFTENLPNDLKNVGVDLSIDDSGDLVFDSTGDLALAYGLSNAAQALNLKVQTKAKDLIRDPSFGIIEIAGKYNNSEITQTLLTMLLESAISGDDRFKGVNGLGYTITETAVFINATIKLAGSNSSIPLTFQIPKG